MKGTQCHLWRIAHAILDTETLKSIGKLSYGNWLLLIINKGGVGVGGGGGGMGGDGSNNIIEVGMAVIKYIWTRYIAMLYIEMLLLDRWICRGSVHIACS